jgi:hypothetical protein
MEIVSNAFLIFIYLSQNNTFFKELMPTIPRRRARPGERFAHATALALFDALPSSGF